MATSPAVRHVVRVLLAVVVVGSLTTACKKSGGSDPDVDPRDQYVGSYEGEYSAAIQIANGDPLDAEKGTATISVTKSSSTKEIYLDILFNKTTSERLTAEVNGTGFTIIDKKQDKIVLNTTTIDAQYSATGVFDTGKKTIAVSTVSEGLRGGLTYTKRGAILGTKK